MRPESRKIDTAADHLLRLRDKADQSKMAAPSFLMVLTGGEFAYTRSDGIHAALLATILADFLQLLPFLTAAKVRVSIYTGNHIEQCFDFVQAGSGACIHPHNLIV